MKTTIDNLDIFRILYYVSLAILIAAMTTATPALSQEKGQIGFEKPQLAADALVKAAASFDQDALRSLLGPEAEELIASSDPVMDRKRAASFASAAGEKLKIEKKKDFATISVGNDAWPLPIPIVKRNGKWYFDAKEGKDELLARRIGSNELDAITICRGYVEAQLEYAREAHDRSGVHQYAQRIISTEGTKDGLLWKNEDGTAGGPISESIARAIAEGYSLTRKTPYHGYYFKILTGQGPSAPLGEIDFVINGVMIGGFALVATPAEYGVTGIKTFMISHSGVVYQKDLGKDSLKSFTEMTKYDPDKTWTPTNDAWPPAALDASLNDPQ